jgi:hypothetical protein
MLDFLVRNQRGLTDDVNPLFLISLNPPLEKMEEPKRRKREGLI